MNFDLKKNDFNKIFEDVQKPSNTKDDKLDKLKQYNEYWNFEKNYHYNSKIDSIIKKINQNYSFDKKEQTKLMKDIINQICGKAATYLGLSWDMIGDEKYLFGFYETNGSKNHMKILIPYDFKFSSLKQKMLDWFLKKQESKEGNMDIDKKPSIKVVESFTRKTSKKSTSEVIDKSQLDIPYDSAISEIDKIFKFLDVTDAHDGNTLLYGAKGRYSFTESTRFFRFLTERKFKMDTYASHNTIEYGCELFLRFFDDNTFRFFFYLENNHWPQKRLYWINFETNTLVQRTDEGSRNRRVMMDDKIARYPLSIQNFNILKSFIEKFTKESYNNVLGNQREPYQYHHIEMNIIPAFEEFVFDTYVNILKDMNISSPLLESFTRKTAKKNISDVKQKADDMIIFVPFETEEMKEFCINVWGSEESKEKGELLFKDLRNVTSIEKKDFEKVPESYHDNSWSFQKRKSTPFNEFKYFTNVISIGSHCWEHKIRTIDEITLPNSVKRIEDYAFSYNEFTKVILNEGLEYIGNHAFSSPTFLEEIEIPSSVKEIGECAFGGKPLISSTPNPLRKIILNEGLEKIGARAFASCRSLETIKIPSTVKEIGGGAFDDCPNIKIDLSENDNFILNGNFLMNKDGSEIITTFGEFEEEFSVPEGVKVLKESSFSGCKIKKLNIPDSVEIIEDYCFGGCPLTHVHLGKNVRVIGAEVFRGKESIIEINFPDSLEKIGKKCFLNLTKLGNTEKGSEEKYSILDLSNCSNLSELGEECFYGLKSIKKAILPENGLIKTLNGTFAFCDNLEECNIPKGVEELKSAFSYAKNVKLTNDSLPSSIKIIENPFKGCHNIDFHFETLPSQITKIDGAENISVDFLTVNGDENGEIGSLVNKEDSEKCNYSGMKIKELRVSEGVKKVYKSSFSNCQINKLYLPETIEELEEGAFDVKSGGLIYFKPSKKMPLINKKYPFGWGDHTIFCDDKKWKSFTTSKKYQEIFRGDTILRYSDTTTNQYEEGYGEKENYNTNQLGHYSYTYKILTREFERTDNSSSIYWAERMKKNVPELEVEYKFKNYSEKPVQYFTTTQTDNVEFKKQLNEIELTFVALEDFLKNFFVSDTGKTKVTRIFNDKYEADFNIAITYQQRNTWTEKIENRTSEFLFKLIFTNGQESSDFVDTEIERLKKQEEKKYIKYERDYEIYRKKQDKKYEREEKQLQKEREKRRKQYEREQRKIERENEKQRLKEENKRQRELRKQMKNTVSDNSIEESFKFDFNKKKKFDFDSRK